MLLHLVLLLALRNAMHVSARQTPTAIEVVLLDAGPPVPPMPQPPPFPRPTQRRSQASVRLAPTPISVPEKVTSIPAAAAPAQTGKPLELFQPDGRIWQPQHPAAPAPTPRELAWELMHRGHNIVHCQRSMFADGYRKDESLGDRIARKYLSWIGMYGQAAAERLEKRLQDARDACDGI